MYYVGKLDKRIYSCVTEDIATDEVVLTDKQIEHIKEHHPNDYERYEKYIAKVVASPDYVVEANKPYSALLLKKFENGLYFKSVLRIKNSADAPEFKNSVITFMKIDDYEYNRLVRNKKILYKSE